MVKNSEMLRIGIVIGLICLFFIACFQPESGCLDIEAKNFSPAADEQCAGDDSGSSCPCTYPTLSFDTIDYAFTKLNYEPETIYQVDDQYFRIRSIQFYLSGFQFIRTVGEKVIVEDTLSLFVLDEENQIISEIFTDDYLLINQQNSIDIGPISQSGQFDSLRFVVGVGGQANTASPDSISNTRHPLAETEMHTGVQNQGYIFTQIVLNKDTLTAAETVLNISGNANLVEVKMPFSYKTPTGKDFSLGTLRIDHEIWFRGINFVDDSDAVMIKKIVENTSKVFSFSK